LRDGQRGNRNRSAENNQQGANGREHRPLDEKINKQLSSPSPEESCYVVAETVLELVALCTRIFFALSGFSSFLELLDDRRAIL
jgi:hypothetical protein